MKRTQITLGLTLDRAAEKKAADSAFIWLPSGERESERLSYADLQGKAMAIARELPKTVHHKLAALLYPPGLDFISAFFGCMFAGYIAVPLNLPRPGRQTSQLETIFADCAPSVILTTREHSSRLEEFTRSTANSNAAVIATGDIAAAAGIGCHIDISPDDIAYLQYTSGSTGSPKGVVISHRNAISNMEFIERGFVHSADALEVSWLPAFHDMGLVYGVLQPVFGCFPCAMMSPQTFVHRPLRWLESISRYRATHSGGPNFAYELCTRSFMNVPNQSLDLSSWRVAFNGAEPVIAETLARFEQTFKGAGFRRSSFYPAYGLAESTLKVTGPQPGQGPHIGVYDSSQLVLGKATPTSPDTVTAIQLVGCGQPAESDGIYIVNPETRRVCSEFEIGEIWINGPSVGQGYYKNNQVSSEIFHATTPDISGDFLRSGDLGFVHNDHLYVTGRLKDLIVIYGRNYYPHDIERTAEQGLAQLRPRSIAAFSVPNDGAGTEDLILVVETKAQTQEAFEELADKLRADLAQVMSLSVKQIVGVTVGSLPKTSSGKMKRSECRTSFLSGGLKFRYISSVEKSQIQNVLGHGPRLETIASTAAEPTSEFQYLDSAFVAEVLAGSSSAIEDEKRQCLPTAFDSITALQIAYKIERKFGVQVSPVDVLQCDTIADLEVLVENASVGRQMDVEPNKDLFLRNAGIGSSQLSVLYQQVLAPQSVALNISRVVELMTDIDLAMLRATFNAVVARHPLLRASFPEFPETQTLHIAFGDEDDALPEMEVIETNDVAKEIEGVISRVFDLHRGPLFRMALIVQTDSNPMMVLSCHHSISDLWSLSTLFDEFWEEYSRRIDKKEINAHELDWGFNAYTKAEQEYVGSERSKNAQEYWATQASRAIQALMFGKPRPKNEVYRVEQLHFDIRRSTVVALRAFASQLAITLPELIFSSFHLLMGYYSREKVYRIGTSVHARSSARFESALGCLVNVLPVAVEYDAERSLHDAVVLAAKELRQSVAHGDYPYHLNLQKMVQAGGELNTSAVEIMFNFYRSSLSVRNASIVPLSLGHPDHVIDFHGVLMKTQALSRRESLHQMTLTCGEHEGGLLCTFECAVDIFDRPLTERIASSFRTIIERIASHPDAPVGAFCAETDLMLGHHLAMVNGTKRPLGAWKTLPGAFTARVIANPEAVALIEGSRFVTYQELEERTNDIAQDIVTLGRRTCDNVGICAERGIDAIAGILGIIKSNCAYMPIDPDYPDERIRSMIARSNCRLILASPRTVDRINRLTDEVKIMVIDTDGPYGLRQRSESLLQTIPESPAYVIFTSGSTGEPKGVVVDHRAICNRLEWMQEEYKIGPSDRILQKTPFTFDVSVWEIFWPLLCGSMMILAKPEGHRDPSYLADLMEEELVSVVHFVPSMLLGFLNATEGRKFPDLRLLVCSGEALPEKTAAQSQLTFPHARLDNLYGPTEAAVDVTSYHYQNCLTYSTVPIGFPISNVQVYVLDQGMFPVPVGAIGELYLGGIALAHGYVGAPGLTAERFVPNPFGNAENNRLYKTGDLVRWDLDGKLHYIGRTDKQVKLRGQRIELDEIEACLRQSQLVKDCCVLVRETPAGESLVAYLLVAEQTASLKKDIQRLLESKLPRHMVPSQLMQLTSFPISANGKLDAKSLPSVRDYPPVTAERLEDDHADEIEQQLHEIWREVLRLEEVRRDESFFALGGHSIAATQIVARVRKQLGVEIPLAVMFSEDVSIVSLAGEIRSLRESVVQ